MTSLNASRRLFLRRAGAMSALTGTGASLALNLAALGNAAAQSSTDYKALVCLFLTGGNDSMNTVLATDAASWANYVAVRNQAPDSIALLAAGTPASSSGMVCAPTRLGGVLPIHPANPQGRSFALHPLMGSLQRMFDTDRRLAIVSNVGPLVMPTTKAQYTQAGFPRPTSLFSHNDQQNTWQTFKPEGASIGWGGRLADLMASRNAHAEFTAVSAAGNAVWLAGESVRQYQVGSNGAIRLGADATGRVFGSTDVAAALERIAGTSRSGHLLEADLADVARRSMDVEVRLRSALRLASDPLFGTAPASGAYDAGNDPKLQYDNPVTGAKAHNLLAQQFQVVARMIDGSAGSLGAKRQVFFVMLSGFDTHDSQNRAHADLCARVAHALQYFDTTLGAMGMRNRVTTFTASEFGRTFTSNGDGTDHGWGGHHFVMGGAVKGGNLYGEFPVLGEKNTHNNDFDSSPDQLANGVLLPKISVDQFSATLARWFGVSDTDALTVFPNLRNFDARKRNLGFMA